MLSEETISTLYSRRDGQWYSVNRNRGRITRLLSATTKQSMEKVFSTIGNCCLREFWMLITVTCAHQKWSFNITSNLKPWFLSGPITYVIPLKMHCSDSNFLLFQNDWFWSEEQTQCLWTTRGSIPLGTCPGIVLPFHVCSLRTVGVVLSVITFKNVHQFMSRNESTWMKTTDVMIDFSKRNNINH